MYRLPIGLLIFCVVLSGCNPPEARSRDEAEIRSASKALDDAETAKDIDRCLTLYAEDAERFATGSPPISGTEAIRKELQKYVTEPGTFHWKTSKVEVARSGELAYETGTFLAQTTDSKQQPVTVNGKYVLVWKKQKDGKWRIIEDIDNPDR